VALVEQNGQYVPSFLGLDAAGLMLYRTLWENQVLSQVPPSLMLHGGCDVAGVDFRDLTHNDTPRYGTFQNAASLVFYARQLAVVARTTDWDHGPFGFGNAFLAAGAVVGDGWKAISAYLSGDTNWTSTQRKQSYLWNISGDWTLQKYYGSRPANDEWIGAIALEDGVPFFMSTTNATSLADPTPSGGSTFSNAVWFKYTPHTSRVVEVRTCGSDFPSAAQVYTIEGGAPKSIAGLCHTQDGTCGSMGSILGFRAVAGTTYYLMAGGVSGTTGNLAIRASEVPLLITAQPTGAQ